MAAPGETSTIRLAISVVPVPKNESCLAPGELTVKSLVNVSRPMPLFSIAATPEAVLVRFTTLSVVSAVVPVQVSIANPLLPPMLTVPEVPSGLLLPALPI